MATRLPELRRLALLGAAQEADCVENLAGLAGRDVDLLADVRTDSHEHRVEAALLFFLDDIVDAMVERDRDAQVFDSINLCLQLGARHSVSRNSEVNHAARNGSGFANLDSHGRVASGDKQRRAHSDRRR